MQNPLLLWGEVKWLRNPLPLFSSQAPASMDRNPTTPLDLSKAPTGLSHVPASVPRGFLDVVRGGMTTRADLHVGANTIGREGPNLAVHVPDGSVSKEHAVIDCWKDGSFFVEVWHRGRSHFVLSSRGWHSLCAREAACAPHVSHHAVGRE